MRRAKRAGGSIQRCGSGARPAASSAASSSGALRRCRPARGRRAGRPAWRSRCPAASPGAAAPGQQGPAAARRACERAWAGSAPAGRRRSRRCASSQAPAAVGAMPSDTRKSSARNVAATRRASARGPRKNCRLAPRPAARWPRRPARPRACIAAGPAPVQRVGLGLRTARQQLDLGRDGGGAGAPMSAARPQGARPGSGRSRAPAPARRTPGRRQASAGVWRPAAGSAGRRRSRGAWRAGVSKAPGSRPTQRRIAGRPRRLRIWTDSPPGAGASASRKGRAWRGRRRRTDAGRRTAGRWPGPPDAAGAAIRADLGQPAAGRRSCRS